jgi:hypothetical protein
VTRLRKQHSSELHVVYDYCRSHAAIPRKNQLLLTLLEHIRWVACAPHATSASTP